MIHAIGIDPGTSNPGMARLRTDGRVFELAALPVLHDLDELAAELHVAFAELDGCVAGPVVVAVESVSWANHAGHQGQGSGRILEAVGMARLLATLLGARFIEVAPATWRKAVTGSGKATKGQAREIMRRRCIGWPKGAVGLNRSDAAAIALAGAQMAGFGARGAGAEVRR